MIYKTKRRLQTLSPYAKYLCLPAYCLAAALVWPFRVYLPAPLGDFTRDLLAVAFLLVGFVLLFDLLRRPWGIAGTVKRTFARAGLDNAQHELPYLRSVASDRDRPHGKILTVVNKGIPIEDFERNISRIEAGLGGKVYQMEFGPKCKTTLLYLLPMRYVRPSLFTPNDGAIGRMGVNHLINMLIIGPTGTGKTVVVKILITKLVKFLPSAPRLWLLDFKRFDFKEFSDLPHYYGYTDCVQGLEDYYHAFKAQQASGVAGEPNYLIIDEWGSFIMSLDRKEAERCKAMLAELLMLGRAYKFIPIVGIQRPDSSYFGTARDNFHCCLALGDLSPEGRRMVFPDSVTSQLTPCRKREGHLYIDGMGLEKMRIADIPDISQLDAAIREAMSQ